MKVACVMLLSLAVATPALAGPKRSADGVEFECGVTGSSNDGFSIWGTNTTKVRKTCDATCELTTKDGKTETYKATSRPVNAAPEGRDRSQRFELEGKAGLKAGPYRNPDLTNASCK